MGLNMPWQISRIYIYEKQNRDCSITDISLFQRIFLSPANFSLYMNLFIKMNMRKSAYVMSGHFFCPADSSLHMNLFIEMNIRKIWMNLNQLIKFSAFMMAKRTFLFFSGFFFSPADFSFLQRIFLFCSGFFFTCESIYWCDYKKNLNESKTADQIKCIYNGQADISFL